MLTTLNWQTRAIAAYERTKDQALDRVRDDVATRMQRLTGHPIPLETIWVDREARMATLALDGILFRFHRQSLVVVRPCVGCGIKQLESPPISDEEDLGYALGAWEPRCRGCPAEDPVGWLERDDVPAE